MSEEYLAVAEKLRGKHIRTLQTMDKIVKENAHLKNIVSTIQHAGNIIMSLQ